MAFLSGKFPSSSWRSASRSCDASPTRRGSTLARRSKPSSERRRGSGRRSTPRSARGSGCRWRATPGARRRSTTSSSLFDDFFELHGDRTFRDDPAIVGGIALLDGRPVTVIGPQKGRDTKENIRRNFGLPHPEGYRKAIRLMEQAEKFGRPIISLIDVVGAYPGIEAEERGQGVVIAESIRSMSFLEVPIICVVTGEGGSGGALAIGVGNRVLMLENAWYSVISPEMCAQILWRDVKPGAGGRRSLRLTANDLHGSAWSTK